jgi:hypothetical protein
MNNTIQHMTEFNISKAYLSGREHDEVYHEVTHRVFCQRQNGNGNWRVIGSIKTMQSTVLCPESLGSSYLNRTTKSLLDHGYKNNQCDESVDGTELL